MNKPLSLQQQKELQQWLMASPSHLLTRCLLALCEEERQKCADAALECLDNPEYQGEMLLHARKAQFCQDVISLLDKVKSGDKFEYIAVEHSEIQTK